jgi:hypothetical protein
MQLAACLWKKEKHAHKRSDGYPSLYDLWNEDVEFRHTTGLISECDMFFPDEKIAVFCDSTRHHRGQKVQEKDAENCSITRCRNRLSSSG